MKASSLRAGVIKTYFDKPALAESPPGRGLSESGELAD